MLPELPNCHTLDCSDNPDLYYSKMNAEKYKMKYPSDGQHKYYVQKWKKLMYLHKVKKILMGKFDEHMALQILHKCS